MTSELSIFAARLREFIALCAGEFGSAADPTGPAFHAHADAEFNAMALVLFSLQFKQNSAYQKICQARKVTPDLVNHWTEIPAVPTSAFKELEMTCLPTERRARVFHSSGTTAHQPSRHFHSAESLTVYEASVLPWFRENLLGDFQFPISNASFLFLTPAPDQAPNSSLVHMFGAIQKRFPTPASSFAGRLAADNSWTLDFETTIRALETFCRTGERVVLMGTAFSFVHLLDGLAERDLRFNLPAGSRVMETGGYKNRSRALPKAALHALIAEKLGIPDSRITCEYGMSELSSQAYDSHPARQFSFPPWARVQVISPETGREVAAGETGLLRIFDLANVFSVLAVQTEDLAVRRGNGFALLGRAPAAEPRGCSLMAQA